jgi:hypothetical protein
MAQANSQLLLFQTGTVYGETPPAFTGAMVLPVFGLEVTPLTMETVERERVDPHAGRTLPPAAAMKFGTFSFSTYGCASGTAGTAPATSGLLQACGTTLATVAGVSNTYTPSDLNQPTGFGHLRVFHGGGLYQLNSSMGNCQVTYAAGALPLYQWTFTGIYVPPEDGAVIAPTYPTVALDVVSDAVNTATFTLGPTLTPLNREMSTFTLDFGNQIETVDNPGGTKRVRIASREPSASATIRHTTLAEFNAFELASSQTEHAMQLVHGSAGKRHTIAIPRFSYNAPAVQENNNEIFHGLEYLISHPVNSPNYFSIKFD